MILRRFSLLISMFFVASSLAAQTGPAGIGNSTNNLSWFIADSLNLSNTDPIATWSDISGNSTDLNQVSASLRPTFVSSGLNGHATVDFDGTQYLIFNDDIIADDISVFIVYKNDNSATRALYTFEKHMAATRNTAIETYYTNPFQRIRVTDQTGNFSIYSLTTGSALSGVDAKVTNRASSQTVTREEFQARDTSSIGSRFNGTSHSLIFDGEIAEIIVYDEELSSAEQNILTSYLHAKYGLLVVSEFYAHGSTHGNDVVGLGQESDGSNTTAIGKGVFEVSSPSDLDDSEYQIFGHDGAGLAASFSVPVGFDSRWTQIWRNDNEGDVGTINVEFDLGAFGLGLPSRYVVLVDTVDGDFTNGGTFEHSAGWFYDAIGNSVRFTGLDLPDDSYFTLALASGSITATSTGTWDTPGNWSCSCIPGATDIVSIGSPFVITVDANQEILDLTIESGGSLSINNGDTLGVLESLTVEGTFTQTTGTIEANSITGDQTFTNTSGTRADFNNLYISSGDDLDLGTGGWGIAGSVQVSNGRLDASGADSVMLISTASKTSEILESIDGAFTGTFIVQRYIGTRNAGFSNLGVQVASTTVEDWDNELFLSGVGGPDGNALTSQGGIFYSVLAFDRINDKHDTISSTATVLTPGRGYEVYLSSNLTTYTGGAIDVRGTPNDGSLTFNGINQGWNLIGNPYHAFILYDSIPKSKWIPDNYYIYNTDNGAYDFFDGDGKPAIAPGQGFWVNKSNAGNKVITFVESAKTSSSTSAFLRYKKQEPFTLSVTNNNSKYYSKSYVHFNTEALNERDNFDVPYLESPFDYVPSVTLLASNSKEHLIKNVISPLEEAHVLPVQAYKGNEGELELKADNIDELYKNYSCAYIVDRETKESQDLFVEPSLILEMDKGETKDLEIILSNSFTTCQKLIENPTELVQHFEENFSIRNAYGDIYLDYTLDGNETSFKVSVYNLNGQEMASPIIFSASNSGSIPLDHLGSLKGNYLLQIQSDKSFLNKKIYLQ